MSNEPKVAVAESKKHHTITASVGAVQGKAGRARNGNSVN